MYQKAEQALFLSLKIYVLILISTFKTYLSPSFTKLSQKEVDVRQLIQATFPFPIILTLESYHNPIMLNILPFCLFI